MTGIRFIPSKLNLIIGKGPRDGVSVLVTVGVGVMLLVGEDDKDEPRESADVDEVVFDGVGRTQLVSVTDPGVPSAPSIVLRPIALPIVDEITIAVFT
jgi:hypothetical protein